MMESGEFMRALALFTAEITGDPGGMVQFEKLAQFIHLNHHTFVSIVGHPLSPLDWQAYFVACARFATSKSVYADQPLSKTQRSLRTHSNVDQCRPLATSDNTNPRITRSSPGNTTQSIKISTLFRRGHRETNLENCYCLPLTNAGLRLCRLPCGKARPFRNAA